MESQPTAQGTAGNLQTGARFALLGLGINVILAAGKIIAGVVGNSYALIADGIESVLDVSGSIVIWLGLKVAARPPDETHPYGHGKAEPIASAVVAAGVLGAAIALATQSVEEIVHPQGPPAPFTLLVLVVIVVIKEMLYRGVIRVGRAFNSLALQTDAVHHRLDAVTSVAAFIGISIALLGGPGWEAADDWAALFACGLIAFNGFRLLAPALQEIMDTAPRGELPRLIATAAHGVPGVLSLEKCLVRKMGVYFYVDLHIAVAEEITVREGHEIAHAVTDAIQRRTRASPTSWCTSSRLMRLFRQTRRLHQRQERARKFAANRRDAASKPNQPRDGCWVTQKMGEETSRFGALARDGEEHRRRCRERLGRRVADGAQGEQRKIASLTKPRDHGGFHIHRGSAGAEGELLPLVRAGDDQFGGVQFPHGNFGGGKRAGRGGEKKGIGKILRQEKVSHRKPRVERTGKAGTDDSVHLPALQTLTETRFRGGCADAGVKNENAFPQRRGSGDNPGKITALG